MTTMEGITNAAAVKAISVIQLFTRTSNKSIIKWRRPEQTTLRIMPHEGEVDLASRNRSTILASLWGMNRRGWEPMKPSSSRNSRKISPRKCSKTKRIFFLKCIFRRKSLRRREVWRLCPEQQPEILPVEIVTNSLRSVGMLKNHAKKTFSTRQFKS